MKIFKVHASPIEEDKRYNAFYDQLTDYEKLDFDVKKTRLEQKHIQEMDSLIFKYNQIVCDRLSDLPEPTKTATILSERTFKKYSSNEKNDEITLKRINQHLKIYNETLIIIYDKYSELLEFSDFILKEIKEIKLKIDEFKS